MELTTFGPKLCSRKIGYANALSLGTNSCEKKERDHFEQRGAGKAKKQCTCVVTKNKSRAVSIASSKSCQTNKDLFGVEIKLKESIFKDNNQINSTITTRSWGLSTEWTRTWPSAGLASKWKNGSGPLLIEWWILLVRVRGYCVVLTKIKAMSLSLSSGSWKRCCQNNFSGTLKGSQIILEPYRNLKYPIRCLLWWHETLAAIRMQAYSEPLQTSKMECFFVNS